MKKIEATYRIVTPMFIGGANQKAGDGIRPPSFKGALRFWWRALNWGRFQNLAELHKEEARLFGAASKKVNGKEVAGQGKFLLSIEPKISAAMFNVTNFSPRSYMLGQGLWDKGKLTREAVSGSFITKLRFREGVADADIESIVDALRFLGLVGGLGSRSRRGWGSVTIERLMIKTKADQDSETVEEIELPSDRASYEEAISAYLVNASGLPPFTSFSSASRAVFLKNEEKDSLKVVDAIGKEMGLYRSWGYKKRVFGQEAEQNFKPDHDSILDVTQGISIDAPPERLVFGMPHNYFFSSTKGKVDIPTRPRNNDGGKKQIKRRASPLFVHVHQLPNGKHVGLLLLLASEFLPEGTKVQIGGSEVPGMVDWTVIEKFMRRDAFMEGGNA